MNVLGIIFHESFGHPAACLLKGGQLVAMTEEERWVRVKQAKGYFPGQSIRYCLKAGGISLSEVDYIAFGWNARKYPWRYTFFLGRSFLHHRFLRKRTRLSDPQIKARPTQGSAIISGLKDILSTHPKNLEQNIVFGLREAGFTEDRIPPIRFVGHHQAHAATAFFCSGFDQSAVLVYDGHGEENTITFWKGNGDQLKLMRCINIPHSLGWFYSMFTEYLGWNPNEGEVKMMGLAPYGQSDPELESLVAEILQIGPKGVKLNPDYLFYNNRSYGRFYSDLLVEKLGPPRGKYETITQRHKNLAAAVQNRLEEAGLMLAREALQQAKSDHLCLAGGVALNCKMNGKIHQSGVAQKLFVQPVSYDAGVALGAAMVVSQELGEDCRFPLQHLHWGPEYSDREIEDVLIRSKVPYRKSETIALDTAKLLAKGNIVAWFQGRMEVGPRALGARSVLADPSKPDSPDRVNALVKFREAWRPFALSILEGELEHYVEDPVSAPFMIVAFDTLEKNRNRIQGAMHPTDLSTRPQTVDAHTHPLFHSMIAAFKDLTGAPGVLNTSFNIKGEPIVCSPEDALRCFYATGMDALAIGNFIVEKSP